MMNKNLLFRLLALLVLNAMFFASCEDIEKDVLPEGEKSLDITSSVYALKNNSVLINTDKIKSLSAAELRITQDPSKGSLKFLSASDLLYTPLKSFQEGKDEFAISLMDKDGKEIDMDAIQIILVKDTSDLPCLNGASTDYFHVDSSKTTVLDVLKNDALCDTSKYSNVKITALTTPAAGSLKNSKYYFEFTPNSQGSAMDTADSFIYKLEVFGGNNELIHSSKAIVYLDYGHNGIPMDSVSSDSCKSVRDDYFVFDKSTVDSLIKSSGNGYAKLSLDVLKNDTLCGGAPKLELVTLPQHFEATVENNKISLLVNASGLASEGDKFIYSLCFDNGRCGQAEVFVRFAADSIGGTDSTGCLKAVSDSLSLGQSFLDSIANGNGAFNTTLRYNVLANDILCNGVESMEIVQGPIYAKKAYINSDFGIVVEIDEASDNMGYDQIGYKVCSGGECQVAYLNISYNYVQDSGIWGGCQINARADTFHLSRANLESQLDSLSGRGSINLNVFGNDELCNKLGNGLEYVVSTPMTFAIAKFNSPGTSIRVDFDRQFLSTSKDSFKYRVFYGGNGEYKEAEAYIFIE